MMKDKTYMLVLDTNTKPGEIMENIFKRHAESCDNISDIFYFKDSDLREDGILGLIQYRLQAWVHIVQDAPVIDEVVIVTDREISGNDLLDIKKCLEEHYEYLSLDTKHNVAINLLNPDQYPISRLLDIMSKSMDTTPLYHLGAVDYVLVSEDIPPIMG